jgi:hypothetical protein
MTSAVDPISLAKQLQPAEESAFLVRSFDRDAPPGSRAASALFTILANRSESILDFLNLNIWWSANQPSRVSGGCAIGGVVIQ